MRIAINLASRPYIELRPVYSRLRVWMAILAALGLAFWLLLHAEKHQADEATARVQRVRSHIDQYEQQERNYQELMREPKNAAVLEDADFLNNLFRHKAFSWTATMTDLETVLPVGVQVQSIEPIVSPNGHVSIRMRVSGGREHAVDLVRNLEKSKHFVSPRLADEALATGNGPQQNGFQNIASSNDVNFDILADYRPLPLSPKATDEDKKEGEKNPALSLTPVPHAAHHTPGLRKAAPKPPAVMRPGPNAPVRRQP
jgi:type IV pilus assembly protein PilN